MGSGGRDGRGYVFPAYIVPARHLRLPTPVNDNKTPLTYRLRQAAIVAGVTAGVAAALISLFVV